MQHLIFFLKASAKRTRHILTNKQKQNNTSWEEIIKIKSGKNYKKLKVFGMASSEALVFDLVMSGKHFFYMLVVNYPCQTGGS